MTEQLTEYTLALRKWRAAQELLEESRNEYLAAKDFGSSASLFTSAVVLAEAYCLEHEASWDFEQVVAEEVRVSVLRESLA